MPEFRKDPITGRWVIIATDRARRPSDFSREKVVIRGSRYCPFCPGHEEKTPPEILAYRQSGGANQPGWTLRVVPNKFPALRIEGDFDRQGEGVYDRMNGIGAHEVIIETPDHHATLADLPEKRVEDVFWAFRDRIVDLKKDRRMQYLLIFKNHGESAGASLEHTHSQLIALPVIPRRVQEELEGARRYFEFKDRCIFCDIVRQDAETATRVVLETRSFLVTCPFASRFPFELWILPRRHHSHFEDTDPPTMANLAWVMRVVLRKLDRVLEKPAYNFIIHTSPVQEPPKEHYHWHIELTPRLTRIAGFEWGTGFYINPTPPEEAARFLREAGLG
ncbi:MAG: galactose-1-phosphate uridylyltransferase [Bryobacterales bacterium]|nr:galactose-1-phosphate uridylyltransferase [Bryobacteraceae bacterium]MDW8130155.1 galactose-1-phosphate uridylyltransferase [Bryobacterales bacterium]